MSQEGIVVILYPLNVNNSLNKFAGIINVVSKDTRILVNSLVHAALPQHGGIVPVVPSAQSSRPGLKF